MSIFKRLLSNKTCSSKSIIKNSVIAGTIIFSGFGQDVMAKGKSYVAVEPLVCDLVKSIALRLTRKGIKCYENNTQLVLLVSL